MSLKKYLEIHFTTIKNLDFQTCLRLQNKKLRFREAFSYIEVVASAVILSLLLMPLASGFHQSIRTQEIALSHYRVSLHTQNIAEDLAELLAEDLEPERIKEYFSNEVQQYDFGNYSCHIYIAIAENGELSTKDDLYFQIGMQSEKISLEGITYEGVSIQKTENIKIVIDDTENVFTGDENIIYKDNEIFFTENFSSSCHVDLEIGEITEAIRIHNDSGNTIFLHATLSANLQVNAKNIILIPLEEPKQKYFLVIDTYTEHSSRKRFVRLL